MTICIAHSDCRKAVIIRYEGRWSWAEYMDANRIAAEMAEESARAVTLIHDFTTTTHLPGHFFARLPQTDALPLPDNLLYVMTAGTIGDSRLHLRMVRLASRGAMAVSQFDTVEEALSHIATQAA